LKLLIHDKGGLNDKQGTRLRRRGASGDAPEAQRIIRSVPNTRPIPAAPDSEYGWERLFSDDYIRPIGAATGWGRQGRYQNILGPLGTWTGGTERAPAAICRRVAETSLGSSIETDQQCVAAFGKLRHELIAMFCLMPRELRVPSTPQY
jgi:hypothetical protein